MDGIAEVESSEEESACCDGSVSDDADFGSRACGYDACVSPSWEGVTELAGVMVLSEDVAGSEAGYEVSSVDDYGVFGEFDVIVGIDFCLEDAAEGTKAVVSEETCYVYESSNGD